MLKDIYTQVNEWLENDADWTRGDSMTIANPLPHLTADGADCLMRYIHIVLRTYAKEFAEKNEHHPLILTVNDTTLTVKPRHTHTIYPKAG
jgi:hypothetical protein